MLKFLPLLWANLQRKKLRTWLTLASIMIAFVLFGMLQTLGDAMTGGAQVAGADRLMTTHKMSLILSMPQAYVNKVRAIPGVKVVCLHNWFGGMAKTPDGEELQIPAFAVDAASFVDTYPEFTLSATERRDFVNDRGTAIIGRALARQFGWKVGDVIPLRSAIWERSDGSKAWSLRIAGIFEANNPALYLHYEYFNEARKVGRDSIGWMVLRIADTQRAGPIGRSIDALFANSPTETKTATERAFAQDFANQLGDIGAIVAAVATAVFFTMLLVTANTMAEAVRERTSELGVLKTLGFSSRSVTVLVLCEALLLTLLGAVLGLALADVLALLLAVIRPDMFPPTGMPVQTFGSGVIIALTLGALAAVLPSIRAWNLRITDALRKV